MKCIFFVVPSSLKSLYIYTVDVEIWPSLSGNLFKRTVSHVDKHNMCYGCSIEIEMAENRCVCIPGSRHPVQQDGQDYCFLLHALPPLPGVSGKELLLHYVPIPYRLPSSTRTVYHVRQNIEKDVAAKLRASTTG